jgi:succinate dehydrogenase/fumarate reductase cytochrome b subunit
MRLVAITGWIVIVASFLVWQGLGLTNAPEWPTMSQLFRDFMALPFGRYALFGVWLWLGWHLFARGADALL